MRSIWHNAAAEILRFGKFPPQICESCRATYWRKCKSALQSTSGPRTDGENSVQIDTYFATLSLFKVVKKLTKNAVLNLSLCCSANWRRREKPQYRCTTTIHHMHKSPTDVLENLFPVWLLMRKNLFIPSRFWTTHTKFDTCTCCQRYVAT